MSRSSRPNLIAYPLPNGEWNVVDANGSGNAYRARMSRGKLTGVVNRHGRALVLHGSTARSVARAIEVKRMEMGA